MCIRPKKIKNRKYTANQKNGGIIPPINDKRQLYIDTPCKQCYVCKKKLAREWKMRLSEDLRVNNNAKVVMLSFSTDALKYITKQIHKNNSALCGYELDNEICRYAVKHFRERWRKKYGRSIRHWFITELGHGKTEHVHMHGLVWEEHEVDKVDKETGEVKKIIVKHKVKGDFLDEVERVWQYGFVGRGRRDWATGKFKNWIGPETAGYFVKYVSKKDEMHREYKQIVLTSAGIGKAFLESERAKDNKYNGKETKQLYNIENGGVLPMPEYFRRKLYSDEEREKLTSWYLDKNIIYIAGTEYRKDIGDDKINLMRKALQERNAQLGYGDGRKNYARKILENNRRREIHKKRGILDNEVYRTKEVIYPNK